MVCTYCGGETQVTNSRPQKRNNQIWRRRKCLECNAIFTSHEAFDLSGVLLVDSSGPKPFLEDKLYSDVQSALRDHPDSYSAAREATQTIIQKLLKLPQKPLYSPKDISRAADEVLEKLDHRAVLRYRADHPSLLQ